MRFLAALSLAFSSPLLAEEPKISAEEEAALKLALDRGLAIYNHDQAAWHTTDTAREDIKDINSSGIRGWVVTESDAGFLVTYWRPDGDGYAGVYSAVWNPDGVTERKLLSGDAANLSAEQIKLIEARQAALNSKIEITRCSKSPFNLVVLPPKENDDPIFVYFLVPQADLESVPLGKHYRFAVKDGKVISHRAFTKGCITLPLTGDEEKGKPESFFLSHVLDPTPTEIHVFSVFAARVPIFVNTTSNKSVWSNEISAGQPRIQKIR